ncbi:alpha/beta hydrolase [Nocardia brevicatena]|uniref:alpha/beta hydrolase n=1 Tax=Nocardia brevicatena TaxID=37327 RepID=UPI000313876E|nr:alpha/beta hydrolase [Nocardia brevicatena]
MTVVGHSLGGGIVMACDSPRIGGRLLPAPSGLIRLTVATGEHDIFLPPDRLDPAVSRKFDRPLQVVPDAGHLIMDDRTESVLDLIDELRSRTGLDKPPRSHKA